MNTTTLLHNLRRSRAPFFYCRAAATTTLSGKAAVKPKNPWAVRPIKPKNLFPAPFGRPPYFLATTATARMMRAMPMSSQKLKVRWKMRKEKMMEDSGSMAEMMLASVGRM